MASENKKEEGVNSKGKVIKIECSIRNINYKATKKQTKRPIKKRAATLSPNL